MRRGKVLSTNVAVAIPNYLTSFDELPPYLQGIKGSPNSFSTSITDWKDVVHTPLGERVRNFLNGEKVYITENQLTVIVSKKLIPNAESAKRLVDYIINGNYITINPKINNYLPIKAEIEDTTYKISSQIYEEKFFNSKATVKIRVNFKTYLQLDTTIPDIPKVALDNGVSTAPYADFFKVLKKYMNEPDNLYIMQESPDKIQYSISDSTPMVTTAPKNIDDIKRIFFQEYFFKYPVDLESLSNMAIIFGTQGQSSDIKAVGKRLFPTHIYYGDYFEDGASAALISFPNNFTSIGSFYDKLQQLIEVLDNAYTFLLEIDVKPIPESESKTFCCKSVEMTVCVNMKDTNRKTPFSNARSFSYYQHYYMRQNPTFTQDPRKNFDNLKEAISTLVSNSKSLAKFMGHDLIGFFKNQNVKIRRHELSEFIFYKIMMDPMLFTDCGNPYYEKISKMIMSL